MYFGSKLWIGDLSGGLDEQDLDEERGPASSPTFLAWVNEGIVGGFMSLTDAPSVSQAIDAVARLVVTQHGFPNYRALTLMTSSSMQRLGDRHWRLRVKAKKENIKALVDQTDSLGKVLGIGQELLDSRDAEIEVIVREKKNQTWFRDRVVSRFLNEARESGAFDLLSGFEVDSPQGGGINFLKEELTSSQVVPLPEGRRFASPSDALSVIAAAYAEIKDRVAL